MYHIFAIILEFVMLKRREFMQYAAPIFVFISGCAKKLTPKPHPHPHPHPHHRTAMAEPNPLRAHGVASEPTLLDPAERCAARLRRAITGGGYGFDPITLTILSAILCGVVQWCTVRACEALAARIRREPNGDASNRLRAKLRTHFLNAQATENLQLFSDTESAEKYAGAAIVAICDSKPGELGDWVLDVQADANVRDRRLSGARVAAHDWGSVAE